MKILAWLAATAAALMLTSTPAFAAAARLTPASCAEVANAPEALAADCGYLHVPENRQTPDSREIQIPFMRVRTSAAAPAPDPLIMLTGGPGNRGIHADYAADHPVLATRDVIWFEQRGTELTRPALNCPEYVDAGKRAARGEIDAPALARARIAAAAACAARARAEGADLRGYNSREIAADIEDLRRLLGYPEINLYGVSYGGRIATIYARDFPEHTRALVLNTPLPVEVNYDEFGSAGMRRTLNMVFDGCAVDPACHAAFPNLREEHAQILRDARRRPRRVVIDDPSAPSGRTEIRVTDRVLAGALSGQLYAPFQYEVLPRVIHAIANGDEGALISILGTGEDNQAWLMRIAVWCNEEYPFEDKAAIRRQASDYSEFAGVDESTIPIGVCEGAGFTDTPPARDNEPVSTDTPVLLFSGAYDPATQPAWQSAMLAHMPHAFMATFPAGGHSSGFYYGCAWSMLTEFVIDPTKAPNAACLLELRPPDFSRATNPPQTEANGGG